ncbi:Ig-like domain-containing protein [Neobacillus sp. 179-C4.2 HS]|uniref:Ig-like domain-containing protein n=1 Tax=Neobacillus driksii TaxID=3035913 RepID=A0ABV4YYY9_9BACI|nr:Ig-like domain-containing protein [Neobacillus sp. 179.-C4.2 HS]MDP5194654.1 Ig-like domain-containing protein [Neobacillus sp. 179.-C4.2 HS]
MGFIDTPAAGSTVNGMLKVRGWILDPSGVSKVDVFVDGKVIGQAKYGLSRPDVFNVFPDYQNTNAGYEFDFDTSSLTNGSHSISVKSTSKTGATLLLQAKTINVQNLAPTGHIDSPTSNSSISGITNVRGWFLDVSGITKVEVLVDGKIMGQATYGISRPDVLRVLPGYQNANAGYEFAIDTRKLTNGTHVITVRGTGNNGTTTVLPTKTVNVKNLPTVGFMDTPKDGSTIKGITNVRGWYLDISGVSKMEILVDGKIVGQAKYGGSRPDVQRVLPDYQNANAGYEFALDTNKLSNGWHSITVRETGKNGASHELQSIRVNVKNAVNLELVGFLDAPANGSVVKGISTVRGWFLDDDGIARVDVLVDGQIVGQAKYGLSRTDVQRFYPEYNNANGGYEFALDTKKYSNGAHKISVRATGKNGSTKQFDSNVSIQNLDHLPTVGFLDSPKSGSTVDGVETIRGWYLDGSGVEKIEVFVDGKLIGNAQYGLSRPDVANVLPEYLNSNSGFQYSLDTKQITDGPHTLTIKETGKNGTNNTLSASITIKNGSPYLSVNLMKPANITASDIVNFFNSRNQSGSPLKNYAQSFIDAQNRYGVNAQYLVAHAIWETGWGGSDLIGYKNNLYGYGAYDPCPFTCGYYFQSVQDSIFRVAYQVRVDYLNETGTYYNGPNLIGMNVNYATDQNWKNGIANLMQGMKPYDNSYYSSTNVLGMSNIAPPPLVRDIPAGLPYPEDTIINFPSGINAKIVNTSSLTFRSLPYILRSTVIGTIPQGTAITVLGYNTDVYYEPTSTGDYAYRWYRVSVNGQTGWLYGGYLEIQNLAQVTLAGGSLNIRSSASTDSSIITSVSNGAYLNLVTNNGTPVVQNGWYQVFAPNTTTTGWVSGDFIKRVIN